jgi:DNA-binding CsgD family transcriptional regulator
MGSARSILNCPEREEQIMAHYAPGSQTRALLDEKERIAERLLKQGLTVTQICKQLRCSPHFVRQVRQKALVQA